ncbi:MAG: phosphoserine phosphatase [Thermoplasmatales archaeon]|nr:phosphoserine phosphatase [Thermoplasmatales archaeon]MCW6171112.1 phosphoserine phosphatase [Thermoplasmatales archaeon]
MTELLEEFDQKHAAIREQVEEHIKMRDEAAAESHKFAEQRDILNDKVHEMREEAKKKIAEKNNLIEQVQKLRTEKEDLYKILSDLKREYAKLRDEIDVKGIDRQTLRFKEKELKRLETKQQTTLLEKKEEQKVVSEIRKLNNEIIKLKEMREKELSSNKSTKELIDKISETRKLAEAKKKEIDNISTAITALSEEINEQLTNIDETRKQADELHEQFIKFSQESTKEHEEFIKAKNDLRDLEKVISTLRTKAKATKKKEKEGELQKKASTLFDRFKNGEQLTTEDLLVLQKAGFL